MNALTLNDLHLTTERLSLRPMTADDGDLTVDLFTDAEVVRHFGPVLSDGDARKEAVQAERRGAGGRIGIWTIADTVSGVRTGAGTAARVAVTVRVHPSTAAQQHGLLA